ncbi:MAG TPA: hypothetical protein VNT75_11775 [Symbiobacteriaceae bacterium]|nr:hypothetical protein [Symbiobacteriaceae bacterium]
MDETVKQVGCDAMKAFLARMHRIELVIIHPEDLSLETLQQKLPSRLPRRRLEGMAPLLDALNDLATEYRERRQRLLRLRPAVAAFLNLCEIPAETCSCAEAKTGHREFHDFFPMTNKARGENVVE